MTPIPITGITEDWSVMASATTPEEVQAIYCDIRIKAEAIEYGVVGA